MSFLKPVQYLALCSIVFSFSLAIVPFSVYAQSNALVGGLCPIGGLPVATFLSPDDIVLDDVFTGGVEVTNTSDYFMAGLQVVIGLYPDETATAPSYWSILPETAQLAAGAQQATDFTLDITNVPSGSYVAKVAVAQGDETAALGTLLRDATSMDSLRVTKESERATPVNVRMTVNDSTAEVVTIPDRTDIVARIETTNATPAPLLNSKMLGVITQGMVPLGAAVRSEVRDEVKLIPGQTRQTNVQDIFVEGGDYSVYAALLSEGVFQPIVAKTVRIADTAGETSWAYVSQIGISEFPLTPHSQVVACVNWLGDTDGMRFTESLGIAATVSSESGQEVQVDIYSDDTPNQNFFAFRPGALAGSVQLSLDFLQERFKASVIMDEGMDITDVDTTSLIKVDTFALKLDCSSGCDSLGGAVGIEDQNIFFGTAYSFWYYLGIVLAATLLMYVMLRRLPPEVHQATVVASPDTDDNVDSENPNVDSKK